MITITIEEAKELKPVIENSIQKAFFRFNKTPGVCVRDIKLTCMDSFYKNRRRNDIFIFEVQVLVTH